jgi:hypothetical protein
LGWNLGSKYSKKSELTDFGLKNFMKDFCKNELFKIGSIGQKVIKLCGGLKRRNLKNRNYSPLPLANGWRYLLDFYL